MNCQIAVFLAYALGLGTAFIDRALYLPQEWTDDRERRAEAGVPEETAFATKLELVQRMLARAFAAGVPARWVVTDAFSGRSHELRQWLEERGRAYALMTPKTNAVRYQGQRERAELLGDRLCPDPALDPWACLERSGECAAGMRRWLLVRCNAEDPDDDAYFLAFGPEQTPEAEVVRVCTTRWQIEEGFAQAKGEVGLDQYEVRKWGAWHRHATLCLLAHAYLVAMCHAARQDQPGGEGEPVPAVRRLVVAMGEAAEPQSFRLGWSRWRRTHQAVAARCHAARGGPRQAALPLPRAPPPLPAPTADRTDEAWHGVASLLAPQKPTTERPRHDHRTVLTGILWVVRSQASWRAMPQEYGKWETAYQRYRLWRATGLWPRILAALAQGVPS